MAARTRGKRGRGKPKKSVRISSISELDALTFKADDLAILAAYIEIISNIVGLWSLYLAKIEDTLSAEQEGDGAQEQPTLPAGAVRSNHRRKKNKKRKA